MHAIKENAYGKETIIRCGKATELQPCKDNTELAEFDGPNKACYCPSDASELSITEGGQSAKCMPKEGCGDPDKCINVNCTNGLLYTSDSIDQNIPAYFADKNLHCYNPIPKN